MTKIPKRPKDINASLLRDPIEIVEYLGKGAAYEHAVAMRAVEALKELAECNDGDVLMSRGDIQSEAADALRDIKASGWKP